MPISLDTLPEDDSDDLSQEEADTAIPTASTVGIIDVLKSLSCASCGARPQPTDYRRRRRGGHLFWKVLATCPNEHEAVVIMRTDWMRGAG